MGRGRPPKRPRNINGLRNQPRNSSPSGHRDRLPCARSPVDAAGPDIPSLNTNLRSPDNAQSDDSDSDDGADLGNCHGCTRSSRAFTEGADGWDSDSEMEQESECEPDWEDDTLCERMVDLAMNEGDNLHDEDWLPRNLKRKRRKTTGLLHDLSLPRFN